MAQIFYMAETDSTNSDIMRRAAQGAPEETISVALKQTGGRGRMGKSWFSPEGGLYFSMLFRPETDVSKYYGAAIVAALSAAEALWESVNLEVGVHLPNDLYCSGKKTGGILIETIVAGNTLLAMAVGIGLNIDVKKEDFPRDIRETATSVLIETGKKIPPRNLIIPLRTHLIENFGKLKTQGFGAFLADARESCITLGKRVSVRYEGRESKGEANDITSKGALLFKPDDGPEIEIPAPDSVTFI
ncbi:MAG: biotin--[acetyl-CoA-carboxylase] ligase [Chloroflexi bacterium]|nr:biotin--[acetyl-CoA-carboxylase] ligase [Chloroflexota bacterium]